MNNIDQENGSLNTENKQNSLLKLTASSRNNSDLRNGLNKDPYLNLREPFRQRQVGHQCNCREHKISGCYEN